MSNAPKVDEMSDLMTWALAYVGVGVLAGLLRLLLLKRTNWNERVVTWVCRLGPGLLFLAYLLIFSYLSDPETMVAFGLATLLAPTFILPLIAICYAGVWASEWVLPRETVTGEP